MKTLSDIYATLSRAGFNSDKGSVHSYLPVYAEILEPYRTKRLLEIGLFNGDSMRMWERYFSGEVHGIDLCDQPLGLADLRPMIAEGTHHIHMLDAADVGQVQREFGEMTFDVVIEDASHDVSQQLSIYRTLRPRLNPGAMYVIEDVQDIDASRETFEAIDPERSVEILDLRHVKGRYDDVLVIIR